MDKKKYIDKQLHFATFGINKRHKSEPQIESIAIHLKAFKSFTNYVSQTTKSAGRQSQPCSGYHYLDLPSD